jgi:hypothetical protein
MLFQQHNDGQLAAPSSNSKLNQLFDWKLGIRTTQDEGHCHLHEDVSEHPLEWGLRTKFTHLPRRVPGMDLVVAVAKSAIRQEEMLIADRKVRLSVSLFSRKRLNAQIVAIMMVIGINFRPTHPNRQ